MTDEEKKAIERLDKRLTIEKYTKNIGTPVYIDDLKIALNLIQKQKEEIEKKDRQLEERTNRINNLEKECQKYFEQGINKDKIIDEMAEEILYENNCSGKLDFEIYKDKEEVIKDFEKKVEEDK